MGMSYVWQKMKVLRKGSSIVQWNIWKNKDRKEKIRREIGKIGRDWVPIQKESYDANEEEENEWENELNKELKMEEMERAVKNMKIGSASGRDGIAYRMTKEATLRIKEEMLKIFNSFWKRGRGAYEWKE